MGTDGASYCMLGIATCSVGTAGTLWLVPVGTTILHCVATVH